MHYGIRYKKLHLYKLYVAVEEDPFPITIKFKMYFTKKKHSSCCILYVRVQYTYIWRIWINKYLCLWYYILIHMYVHTNYIPWYVCTFNSHASAALPSNVIRIIRIFNFAVSYDKPDSVSAVQHLLYILVHHHT